jgi:glutamyl-tRNA reductase
MAASELQLQKKKSTDFDEEQAEIISKKIIQKITNQFASHLKDESSNVDDSIEWIEKVFQIGLQTPQKTSSIIEDKYKINLS